MNELLRLTSAVTYALVLYLALGSVDRAVAGESLPMPCSLGETDRPGSGSGDISLR